MRTGSGNDKGNAGERESGKGGLSRLFGLVLIAAAFLLLGATGDTLYRGWRHDGYRRTEAEVLTKASMGWRYVDLRIAADGEKVTVSRGRLVKDDIGAREAVWYDPDARLVVLGLRLFDERVVSVEKAPTLPSLASALLLFLGALALGAFGALLMFRPGAVKVAKKPRRRL